MEVRAWDKVKKEWCTDNLTVSESGLLIRHHGTDDNDPVITQCIDVNDKNDKKIFEGDVIRHFWKTFEGHQFEEWTEIILEVVVDPLPRYAIRKRSSNRGPIKIVETHCDILPYAMRDKEVIGNIYENPELLENKK